MAELKAWAVKANVALARGLAVVMHRMWVDGSEFRWTRRRLPAPRPHKAVSDQGYQKETIQGSTLRRKTSFADDCDVSSWPPLIPIVRHQDAAQIGPHHLPPGGRAEAGPREKRGPRNGVKRRIRGKLKALDLTMREEATEGRISGILVTSIAEQGKPQEVQHSTSQLIETGTNCPCEPRCACESRS